MTGTYVVPDNTFTLASDDKIDNTIDGMGLPKVIRWLPNKAGVILFSSPEALATRLLPSFSREDVSYFRQSTISAVGVNNVLIHKMPAHLTQTSLTLLAR